METLTEGAAVEAKDSENKFRKGIVLEVRDVFVPGGGMMTMYLVRFSTGEKRHVTRHEMRRP